MSHFISNIQMISTACIGDAIAAPSKSHNNKKDIALPCLFVCGSLVSPLSLLSNETNDYEYADACCQSTTATSL
jgi:hypothetical protein